MMALLLEPLQFTFMSHATADFTGSFHTLCAAVGLSGPERLGTDG
ncbi:Uncharacterised protein [Escherichia coli]|uniref:Uncharacterized protein n=1 Tax=Escherichia coli TaxID=562 RepID=A0A376VKF0_ECOLX|nr:Uncharacterised protein [Escherichia coli]